MTDTHGNHVEELAVNSCWDLLRDAGVGRLAVWVEDHPDIFPINFVVDHGTLVFRSAEGTKVAGALTDVPVAVEIDGYDEPAGKAWSVVVKGRAHEVKELDDMLDAIGLPLFPWHAAPKPRFVRIEPVEVTGRRFHTSGPRGTLPGGS